MKSPKSQTIFAFIVLSHLFVIAISDHVDPEAEKKEFLDLHNQVRQHAGEDPLTWDEQLETYARNYAEKRKGDCNMVHSNGPFGENLFWGGGNQWTAGDAVKMWVREHRFYNKGTNQCQPGKMCGHYTQIVWRDTEHLGCARVQCDNGDTFTTCNYGPPGNYPGEIPFNHYQH
ncbi:pathogenesis-related protein 1C-like [Cornus florida]|uniref:pathogenesis-related protein 1C-like n=1 Tax=Cornus florida TaxID=4283 RepID=UPI002898E63F|nr:pathogenesis-related protein 1C-like [Cornus florida]